MVLRKIPSFPSAGPHEDGNDGILRRTMELRENRGSSQGIPATLIADVKVITQNNKQLTAKADAVQEANECDIQELSTV